MDQATACAAYANAVCAGYDTCLPVAREALYGEVTTCVDRFTLFCSFVLNAAGTSWTPTSVAACADAYSAITCPDFIAAVTHEQPGACIPMPGALADGSPCAEGGQCQTAYCKGNGSGLCGTCTPRSAEGAACDIGFDCLSGLACVGGQCVLEITAGQPCVVGQAPCAQPLICKGGYCVQPAEETAACDPLAPPECFFIKGLYCDPQTSTCVTSPIAATGDACGFVGSQIVVCGSAGFCNAPPGGMGVCVAPAADGGACDAVQGPGCALPAVCFQGACMLPDAAMCM